MAGEPARPALCLCLGPEDCSGPAPFPEEGRHADRFELRLDLFPRPEEALALIGRLPRPVLATVRSVAEGGAFAGSPAERIVLLERAAAAGADWLDAETDIAQALEGRTRARVLWSRHLLEGSGADWRAAWRELAALGRPFKLAAHVDDLAEALDLAELGRAGADLAVPMGPRGRAGRVLAAWPRTRWVYVHAAASVEASAGGFDSAQGRNRPRLTSAPRGPGQWSLAEWRELGWPGPLYGLLGDPLAHSPSPRLHGAALRRAGRAGCYLPLPCRDFDAALAALRRRAEFRGASVTAPHKRAAAAACAWLSAEARAAGAVNTLVALADGRLEGHNTDVLGFAELFAEAGVGPGARALILGRGGAAAAARAALEARGCETVLAGREDEGLLARARACDVLVQATPLSASGLLPERAFRPEQRAFEVVYAPRETAFLAAARAAGARVWDGLELFLRQAVHQVRLLYGLEIDARWARSLLESSPHGH